MKSLQEKLLERIKVFLSSFNSYSYNPYNNSVFYLNTNSQIGLIFLNYFLKRKNLSFYKMLYFFVKNILYSLKYINFKIYESKNFKSYDKIFISWATIKDFKNDGSINDKYFNVNSKKIKKTLWFIIYDGYKLPKKIDKNISLLYFSSSKIFNIFKLIFFCIKNIKYLINDFKFFLASLTNYNFFSSIFFKNFYSSLNNNIKFILMPYEGQSFQHFLINRIKKKFRKIKTIGYIHSPPKAMPSNFVYNCSSPDKIILNGNDQLKCFVKNLGWRKNKIKIYPSFRFLKTDSKKNYNGIYLPLFIRDLHSVIKNLIYLHNNKILDLKKYKIYSHPLSVKKNKTLEKKIYSVIHSLKSNSLNVSKRVSIFIGSSGAIIEFLERGYNVLHITEDPVFDVYNSNLWSNIIKKRIKNNIYTYNLKRKKQLILFGNNKKNNYKKINKLFIN